MMSLAASLAACGEHGSNAPPPPPVAPKAILAASSIGPFPWRVAQPVTVILTDTTGNMVAASAMTCAARDATQVAVSADCHSITALRLGSLVVDVSGGGVTAPLTVKGMPQRQWTGVHGASRYAASTVAPDGALSAWGDNAFGILVQGVDSNTLAWLGVATPGVFNTGLPLGGTAQSTMGERSGGALYIDGGAIAWGQDNFHELGVDVPGALSLRPVSVLDLTGKPDLVDAVQMEIGQENAVALIHDGTVVTWGNYTGSGAAVSASLPVQAVAAGGGAPLAHVCAVSAGWNFSLALTDDGHVLAWGIDTGNGVLGTGTVVNGVAVTPGYVLRTDGTALDNIVQVSAGYDFSLALGSDGTVWAWGNNAYGQLGRTAIGGSSAVAVQVQGLAGGNLGRIAMVAAGGNHALALDLDGRVLAWGYAPDGSLGDGPAKPVVNQTSMPRVVVNDIGDAAGFTDVVSIAAGYADSYALGRDGRMLSWGSNFHGALGRTTTASTDNTPGRVASATNDIALAPASYPNLLRRAR